MLLDTANYHSAFELRDRVTGLVYFEDIELHTIELNKFTNAKEELTDIVKKVKDSLDIWLAFLTRHDLLNKDKLPKKLDNKVLKKALTVLEVMNFNEEERNTYEDRLKWLMIEANTLKKTEMKKAAEIAKEMLIYNEPIEKIIKYTKLSTEEIEKLKREIEESNK
ncbi:PD-(D/E)XK nuclease family transposase [Rickettsia bellii]|uniref:PD-(D/E)XK nuclease family transposase n=1 Tax=Rickettsia bellii TaxID=33990 RepID=UPI00224BED83|nr:PD-(D/E)XK nuclease family transposase [Rickettsia bellii]